MNYRFSKLGDYLGKHFDLSYVSIPKTTQSFSFRFIITRETIKLLNSVNVQKSTGPSDVPPWALKDCSAEIAEHLTFLFNAFITESKFASQSRQDNVTPIFKKGDSEDPQNYRPICLTSVLSKPFEKILANQIYEYLNRFDLISHYQVGFRSKVSTTDALVYCRESLRSEIDKNKHVALALPDLSKAFDSIQYNIL